MVGPIGRRELREAGYRLRGQRRDVGGFCSGYLVIPLNQYTRWRVWPPLDRRNKMNERVYIFFRGWITAALFVAVGCAPTVQGEQKPQSPLTGEEIKQRILGNSVSGTTRDGPYTVHFPDYGEVLGVRSFNYKDRGTWQVKGDQMCIHWDNWWGNAVTMGNGRQDALESESCMNWKKRR